MDKLEDIILAISTGSLDIARHIVDSDHIDINKANHRGQTALSVAAAYGYADIVKYLLEIGANPNVGLGNTQLKPIHIAASNGFPDIVAILRDYGADVNCRDQGGLSPMDYAGISPQPVAPDCDGSEDRIEAGDILLVRLRSECLKALG